MTHSRRTLFLILMLVLAVGALGREKVIAVPQTAGLPDLGALPDLSGLAWVEGRTFLAVHDAKVPDEAALSRVSLIELPHAGEPLRWTPLAVTWPGGAPSHDLESIARVPGTDTYLLAESGNHGSAFERIFVADLVRGPASDTLEIREAADWPVPVYDVEGTAVTRVGGTLYFLFAERADGKPGTEIAWARLTLDPLTLEGIERVPFQSPDPSGPGVRHISALDVDEEGHIYAASAYDPDHDGGPFRSAVWRVGVIKPDGEEHAALILTETPEHLATLDGMKVESLTLQPSTTGADAGGGTVLIVGTDDEDYGGVVRPLLLNGATASDYRSPIPSLTERTSSAWPSETVR
ncbi:MAG: hypothetical protein ABJF88_08540 [Rhodothermales bacterium]